MRPSWQMRRISVLKSPTAAPSKSETSSIKTHPPTADAWPPISSRAYQPVPSPKSLAWAGPYANGRTHSWPTSIPAEQATHPIEAINGHYRTRQTHRQRLPQPHQLQTPNAPHRRRPRRLHPHSTMKSQLSAQLHVGGLLAPVGLSATIAAMGPSVNHTTRPSYAKNCSITPRMRFRLPSRLSQLKQVFSGGHSRLL